MGGPRPPWEVKVVGACKGTNISLPLCAFPLPMVVERHGDQKVAGLVSTSVSTICHTSDLHITGCLIGLPDDLGVSSDSQIRKSSFWC